MNLLSGIVSLILSLTGTAYACDFNDLPAGFNPYNGNFSCRSDDSSIKVHFRFSFGSCWYRQTAQVIENGKSLLHYMDGLTMSEKPSGDYEHIWRDDKILAKIEGESLMFKVSKMSGQDLQFDLDLLHNPSLDADVVYRVSDNDGTHEKTERLKKFLGQLSLSDRPGKIPVQCLEYPVSHSEYLLVE